MRKELILCDQCGVEGAGLISVQVDRVSDPAGAMENVYEAIDLCPACTRSLVHTLIKPLPFGERLEIINKMRKKP